jgi:hypothetical protein
MRPPSPHNATTQLQAADSKARESAPCCCTSVASNWDDFLRHRAAGCRQPEVMSRDAVPDDCSPRERGRVNRFARSSP